MGQKPSRQLVKKAATTATKTGQNSPVSASSYPSGNSSSIPNYNKKLTGDNVKIANFLHERESTLKDVKITNPEAQEGQQQQQNQDDNENIANDTNLHHHHHAHDNNPFRDPRMHQTAETAPQFSNNQSHQKNLERISMMQEASNDENVSEQEKQREEKESHRFGNQLVHMTHDIAPIYEDTVGHPSSPLAMHHSPKSEIMQKQQHRKKYDDLDGMYKVVDIMNFMRDVRKWRKEKMRERLERSSGKEWKGKFYSNRFEKKESGSTSGSNVQKYTEQEMIEGFTKTHNIPSEDMKTILKHFQYPNHIHMRDKEYAFWHDFDLNSISLWKTVEDVSSQQHHQAEYQHSSPSPVPKRSIKRSKEQIEDEMLTDLQQIQHLKRQREGLGQEQQEKEMAAEGQHQQQNDETRNPDSKKRAESV